MSAARSPGDLRRDARPAASARPCTLLLVATLAACHRGAPASSDAGPSPSGSAASDALPAGDGGSLPQVADDDPRFPGRIAALAWEVKIHAQPSLQSPMLGYIRAGGVVAASTAPVSRESCAGGWYAVSPSGFVCVETNVATTDLSEPIVQALARRPDRDARLPYMYGLVRQHSPIYSRVPTRAEAAHSEYSLRQHMEHWLRANDGARFRADYWMRWKGEPPPDAASLWDAHTTEEMPPFLANGTPPPGNLSNLVIGRRLVIGQTEEHMGFAFVDTMVQEGRRYGLTTDLLVVPIDRLRPIEGSPYHGVHIPEDIDVPFALIRRDGAHTSDLRGDTMARRETVARRAYLKITGKEQVVDGRRYFEMPDGRWLCETHASRIDKIKDKTKWAQDGEHWVDVSIARQTLVAYDGYKPVYATLVSTGEAGLDDPETTKSTVLGEFRIFAKHVTTTMSSEVVGEEFQLKDIPYVEYFQEGYALHAAYWHDDFGIPRSHGCINLAPEDARWIFDFTEPHVPAKWHGARSDKGSVVFIHK